MAALTFRLASPADLDRVMALVHATVSAMQAAGIDQWDDVYPDRARFIQDVEEQSLHVAEAAGELVGIVVVNRVQEPEYADVPWQVPGEPIAVIHRLMVAPSRWGAGTGRALVGYAEAVARAEGGLVMRLDTFCGNVPAWRMYERLGYTSVGYVTFRKGRFVCLEKAL